MFDLRHIGWNDRVSSVRIEPHSNCGSNRSLPGIYLYSDINLTDRCSKLPAISFIAKNLSNWFVGNDAVSSLKIIPPTGQLCLVTSFESILQAGKYLVLQSPIGASKVVWDLREGKMGRRDITWNDKISSVQVACGQRLISSPPSNVGIPAAAVPPVQAIWREVRFLSNREAASFTALAWMITPLLWPAPLRLGTELQLCL